MSEFYEDQALDWNNTYLLGWYDENGRSFLTTWSGDLPMIQVVVTGCNGINMPLWNAQVPKGAKLHPVPHDTEPRDYARKLGGYHAFGWRVPVTRKSAS